MVYVWCAVSAEAEVLVMTYAEALGIAETMGFTKTASWKTGVKTGKPGYAVTTMSVGGKLHGMLHPYVATPARWQKLMTASA